MLNSVLFFFIIGYEMSLEKQKYFIRIKKYWFKKEKLMKNTMPKILSIVIF